MLQQITLSGMIHNRFESQSAMAEKLGWSRQRLSRILTGKRMPSLYDVRDIAESLGVEFMDVCQFFLPQKSPYGDPFDIRSRLK